jgi:hypothetical protein
MNNRILNEQINNIKRLFGNKNILQESTPLLPFIETFIQYAVKKVLPYVEVHENQFKTLIRSKTNPTGKIVVQALDNTEQLFKIMSIDAKSLTQNEWKILLTSPQIRKALEENFIRSGIEGGLSIENLRKYTIPSSIEYKTLTQNLPGLDITINYYINSSTKIINTKITTASGSLNFIKKIGNDAKAVLINLVKGIGLAGTDIPLINKLNATKQKWNTLLSTNEKLKTEISSELDQIVTDIIIKGHASVDITNRLEKIALRIRKFQNTKDQPLQSLWESWLNELKSDVRMKETIFNPDSEFFIEKLSQEDFNEIKSYFMKPEGINDVKLLTTKLEAAAKFLGSGEITPIGKSKISRVMSSLGQGISNYFQKIIGTIIVWEPRTIAQWNYNRKVLGNAKWIGKGFGDKLEASVTVIPVVLSFYMTNTAIHNYIRNRAGKDPIKYPLGGDPKLIQSKEGKNINYFNVGKDAYLKNYMNAMGLRFDELSGLPAWSLAAALLSKPLEAPTPEENKKIQDKLMEEYEEVTFQLQMKRLSDPEFRRLMDLYKFKPAETVITQIEQQIKTMDLSQFV